MLESEGDFEEAARVAKQAGLTDKAKFYKDLDAPVRKAGRGRKAGKRRRR